MYIYITALTEIIYNFFLIYMCIWIDISGICGEASKRENCLTLAERGEMDVLKINDDAET